MSSAALRKFGFPVNCAAHHKVSPSMTGSVGEPSQDAGIDQDGHYSYSPSLLRASSDRETPQSVASANHP